MRWMKIQDSTTVVIASAIEKSAGFLLLGGGKVDEDRGHAGRRRSDRQGKNDPAAFILLGGTAAHVVESKRAITSSATAR